MLEHGRYDMGLWFGDRGATPYEFYLGQLGTAGGPLLQQFAASSDAPEQERVCHELQRIFVENAPALPLFAAPDWGVFNTARIAGFPSRYSPYGAAAPGLDYTDVLPVLVEVKPR